jgi:hypothetical protein
MALDTGELLVLRGLPREVVVLHAVAGAAEVGEASEMITREDHHHDNSSEAGAHSNKSPDMSLYDRIKIGAVVVSPGIPLFLNVVWNKNSLVWRYIPVNPKDR